MLQRTQGLPLQMLTISAAALEPGHGRAHRALVSATVVLLFLTIGSGSAGQAGNTATPLVQVTPTELRLSQPLVALAAEGGRASFAFCNQLLGVWRPGATGVTRLGSVAQWTCPPPRGLERTYSLAFAADRVAWIAE